MQFAVHMSGWTQQRRVGRLRRLRGDKVADVGGGQGETVVWCVVGRATSLGERPGGVGGCKPNLYQTALHRNVFGGVTKSLLRGRVLGLQAYVKPRAGCGAISLADVSRPLLHPGRTP